MSKKKEHHPEAAERHRQICGSDQGQHHKRSWNVLPRTPLSLGRLMREEEQMLAQVQTRCGNVMLSEQQRRFEDIQQGGSHRTESAAGCEERIGVINRQHEAVPDFILP